LGFPAEKISLGNMTADITLLQSEAAAMPLSEKEKLKRELGIYGKIMIFIGRLVRLKGVDKLIEAWETVFKTNEGICLLITGDGEEREKLKNTCRDNGIKNIIFTGSIDYDSVYRYLGIADIFIIPSLRDNWSLVVPEAMSCGLPVICSVYNGCWPELVRPENGWVFDPVDRDNFLKTLKTAWENRDNWETMGKESLRVIKNFAPDKIAESIFSACKSLL
jgi:glycosyltransferase involved in cell wall biosynthesis